MSVALFLMFPLCQTDSDQPKAPVPEKAPKMTMDQASAFARLALKGIRKEYPNKPGHVLNGKGEAPSRPSEAPLRTIVTG